MLNAPDAGAVAERLLEASRDTYALTPDALSGNDQEYAQEKRMRNQKNDGSKEARGSYLHTLMDSYWSDRGPWEGGGGQSKPFQGNGSGKRLRSSPTPAEGW